MAKKFSEEQAMAEARRFIDSAMGRPKRKKKNVAICTCTNHLGKAKQQFKTKDSALAVIAKHHMWTGKSYRIYKCPTSARFHITGDGVFKKPRRKA